MSSVAHSSGRLRVGYLVNQYPSVSHTFIRREIEALESLGLEVERVSIRATRPEALCDEQDRAEASRTTALLDGSAVHLALGSISCLLLAPRRFLRAAGEAWRLGWRSDRGLLRHFAYLAEACALKRHLARRGVAHLHAHFATNPAAVAVLCRVLGGPPFSFTAHGAACFEAAASHKLGRKVELASFVVAVSEDGRSRLMRWSAPACWSRIHVVRCGLEPESLGSERKPVPSDRRLVCVARLVPVKAHEVLLEAAAELDREGLEFELVLVGDGPLRGSLEARARRLGLEKRVVFRGALDGAAVREEISKARALVLSSFEEGLPTVILEAFALGRPVVATAVGGVAELVETGATGWRVPPGSSSAMARALREALEAPVEVLARMAGSGSSRVHDRHDTREEARKLARLFRETLHASGGLQS